MNEDICLWSPVVVGSLAAPRSFQKGSVYRIEDRFCRVEDMKVKIRSPQVERQGKNLEARIKLDIIALLEDTQGSTDVIQRQEIIIQRVPLQDMNYILEQTGDIEYLLQINNFQWEGEFQKEAILVKYEIKFMILAVQEQVVKIYAEHAQTVKTPEASEVTKREDPSIAQTQDDNFRLRHKLFLYERDLLSLQRAVKKAEGRNAGLNQELARTRELVEKLREAVTRKDLLICRYENSSPHLKIDPMPAPSESDLGLGQRLKRMFINSLLF